jgi:KDO2-lipid IV(A) lauroyltransferase
VGVLLDQDTGGPAAFAEFFGQPARTPTTPFLIARKWGAEIVPMLIRLEDDRTHRAVVHPALPCPRKAVDHSPLPSEREAEAEGFVLQDVRAWHRILEREIAARPAQWVWFHRRWKSRPRAAVPGHSFAGSPSNEMLITR